MLRSSHFESGGVWPVADCASFETSSSSLAFFAALESLAEPFFSSVCNALATATTVASCPLAFAASPIFVRFSMFAFESAGLETVLVRRSTTT